MALFNLCDVFLTHFIAAEVQGDEGDSSAPAGAHIEDDATTELRDIDFDDGEYRYPSILFGTKLNQCTEDSTNIHRHARRNAQDAIALAKQRAQAFDTQAALERKTNEAMQLAKGQAHLRAESDEADEPSGPPLVDCKSVCCICRGTCR